MPIIFSDKIIVLLITGILAEGRIKISKMGITIEIAYKTIDQFLLKYKLMPARTRPNPVIIDTDIIIKNNGSV
jgi:hypothetical protein